MRTRPRNQVADVALLAAALTSGIGALRLTTLPGSARVVLPVIAAVVAGHVVSSVADRASRHDSARSQVLAFLSSVIAVWLVTIWTTIGFATREGLPTLTTLRTLHERLAQAGSVITSTPTPLPPTTGVIICFAAGAGLVAALGYALWRWKSSASSRSTASLYALVPSFGLFCYASLLSSDRYRLPAAAAYTCGALAFLAVADLVVARSGKAAPHSRQPLWTQHKPVGLSGLTRLGVASGLVSAGVSIAALLLVGPGLSGMSLDALPFPAEALGSAGSGPGSSFGASDPRQNVIALDLIDNLAAFLTLRSQEVMFSARSPVPTYWQVGTLTSFEGSQWVPDESTEIAARVPYVPDPAAEGISSSLPSLPVPQSQSTYSVTVSLAGLGGSLVPVPPSTVSVSGPVSAVPGIGALYNGSMSRSGSKTTSTSITYNATAPDPVAASSQVPPAPTQAQLYPYLTLPREPANVVALAHQIVAGAAGPTAQATALARWLGDSGIFRYTLDPPQVFGADPLYTFLFVTRAGFCQQFAGAFAVLARLDGLPTRLAVGFTAGTPSAKSVRAGSKSSSLTSYRVTGADAHVWPEVYLGPAQGWVSFEPTPAANDEPSGIGVVSGNPSASQSALPVTTTPAAALPTPAAGSTPGHHIAGRGGSDPWIWLWAFLFFVVLAAATGFVLRSRPTLVAHMRNRLRPGSKHPTGPDSMVLARFDTASWSLRRAGLGRNRHETITEHAARIRAAPENGLAETYSALARLAERACYSDDPCTEEDVDEASALALRLRREVHAASKRR